MQDYVGITYGKYGSSCSSKFVDRRLVPFSDFVPPHVPLMMPIRQGWCQSF